MSHYFIDDPNLKSERKSFDYTFSDEHFTFTTDLGVFSKERADFGSYLLIKYATSFPLGSSILDLGCGYGFIGIIVKRLFVEATVDLVDVNRRATELAELNAQTNGAEVQVYLTEEILSLHKSYRSILFNPPIRAGKSVIYGLYERAHRILEPGGSLFLVIRKSHGAESHIRQLKELFNDVTVLGKEAGYWLLKADKADISSAE